MPVKITSMQEGFRRCGIAHGRAPVIYPDGRFAKEQIAALKAEPLLRVEIVKEEKENEKK